MKPKEWSNLIKKMAVFALSAFMVVGNAPMSVFATDENQETKLVTGIQTGVEDLTVAFGTSKESLSLPSEFSVTVQDAEENTSEEMLGVSWNGEYNGEQAGTYVLQSSFNDASYEYKDEMPKVSVTVEEAPAQEETAAPEETVAPEETAAIEESVAPEETVESEEQVMTLSLDEEPEETVIPEETASEETTTESSAEESEPEDLEGVDLSEAMLMTADGTQEVNLVDINAITASEFLVKPKGETEFKKLPLPTGTAVYVGDEVKINFSYTEIKNASADTIYYFDIPEGLNAIASLCRGDIMDNGEAVGSYKVNNGRVELTFNEDYLNNNDNTIDAGTVLFYATLNEDALQNNGEIKLGNTLIGTVPIVEDPEVTKTTVKKWNGDGTVENGGLVYDANKGAVQYTIEVTADAANNKIIDSLDVTDTLTTTVNDVADTSIVTGDYTDITVTPSSATFTKGNDGKYVLHANNVKAGDTIKVTYWVPVKDGIVKAHFINDVEAKKIVGGNESNAGSASVEGDISNTLQVNKSAANPVYHVDGDKTTTVEYTVTVSAPASNTTDIANAYIDDQFTLGGDKVLSVGGFSCENTAVSMDNNFVAGDKPGFTVQLGTMKPGDKVTYKYTAVLDTDKCYMNNTTSDNWLDNWATAKSGEYTFDKSKANRNFKKEFTSKTGVYDPTVGAFKFTVVYDGLLPGKDSSSTNAEDYYNGVLDFLDDEIQTKGKGFNYVGTPAPVLEAYRGPEGSEALLTQTLDGTSIDGQESFHIAVPQDMKGAYSYRLTYYVNLPENAEQTDVVKNTYSITLKGVGSGGSDKTFSSSASASSADASSNALNKELDEYLMSVEGHEGDYASQAYKISISAPIAENATLEDTVTGGDALEVIVPSEYLNETLTVKHGSKTLEKGVDYTLESVDDKSFKITFVKAVPSASQTNPVVITYKGQVVATEAGKEVAATVNGVNSLNPGTIKNSATLTNGQAAPATKSIDLNPTGKITKNVVDTSKMDAVSNDLIAWDIQLSSSGVYDAFGKGFHNLVDTIPADQELVKVEYFADSNTPKVCSTDISAEHGYTAVVNEDGTTTVTINAYSGHINHPETYRVWTRVKASALEEKGINPDNFDNVTFTNGAYYEANGTKWKVAADTTISNHRFSKEVEYGAGTEALGGVKFTLKVNTDGADLDQTKDTITVHDTMNPQLVLKADSLQINDKTIDQIPGAQLVYSGESNQFDLILPDEEAFVVTYIAEIDAEQGDSGWLSNEASIDGRIDTVSVDKTETSRLQVGAGASSKLAFFLKKTDQDGNLLTKDVAFTIAKVNAVGDFGTAEAMTDLGNGTFKYRGITKNSIYVLTETQTPDTYKTADPIYISFGTPNAALKSALEDAGITVQAANTGGGADIDGMFRVINEDETIDIPVTKVWEDGNNQNRPTEITVELTGKTSADPTNPDEGDDGDDGDEGEGDLDIEALDDGNDHATLTITAANNWTGTFTNLPKYKTVIGENGEITRVAIEYSIEEVSVDGYTTTISGDAENGYTVTNKYEVTPITLTIPVTKKMTGNERPSATTFHFTLAAVDGAPLPAVTETDIIVGATDTETAGSFGQITYTAAGTYKYTITERNDGKAGFTYDTSKTVIVTVIDNAGTLSATTAMEGDATATSAIFTNNYTPTPTTLSLPIQKTMVGNPLPADTTFTFTLTGTDVPLPQETVKTITVGAGQTNGTASFTDISFDKAGTFTYTITENNDGKPGMTYAGAQTVTVTVTDTDGVLSAAWTLNGQTATNIDFTNTYAPGSANITIPVKKVLNGTKRPADTTFHFTLAAVDGAPLPTVTETDITVAADGSDASGNFGPIAYTAAGTYKYTITERNDGKHGFTYDTVKEVTVTVTDNNGTLVATSDVTNVTFTNSYAPDATWFAIPIQKIVEGNDRPDGEKRVFTFNLSENGQVIDTKTITDEGTADFDRITYTEAGTYTYTVSEVAGTEHGYTYSTEVHTVVVSVTDTDGVLSLTWKLDENETSEDERVTFTNTYTPDKAEISLNLIKKIEGQARPDETTFHFTMTAEDQAPLPTEVEKDVMVAKDAEASANATFGPMTYTAAGTYKYTITERNDGATGFVYDTAHTVTVTVKDVNGVLGATWSVDDDENQTDVVFTNTYTPDPVKLALPVQKNMSGDARPENKKTNFTFELYDETNALLDSKSVKDTGTVSFDEMEYTKAGTYTYTVKEVNNGVHGYTYDSTVHNIEVVVVDEAGVLKASFTDNGEEKEFITFTNSYKKDPDPKPTPKPNTPQRPYTPYTSYRIPYTGDDSNLMLWSALFLMSLVTMVGAAHVMKQK